MVELSSEVEVSEGGGGFLNITPHLMPSYLLAPDPLPTGLGQSSLVSIVVSIILT